MYFPRQEFAHATKDAPQVLSEAEFDRIFGQNWSFFSKELLVSEQRVVGGAYHSQLDWGYIPPCLYAFNMKDKSNDNIWTR